jgi:hypothetical protein
MTGTPWRQIKHHLHGTIRNDSEKKKKKKQKLNKDYEPKQN